RSFSVQKWAWFQTGSHSCGGTFSTCGPSGSREAIQRARASSKACTSRMRKRTEKVDCVGVLPRTIGLRGASLAATGPRMEFIQLTRGDRSRDGSNATAGPWLPRPTWVNFFRAGVICTLEQQIVSLPAATIFASYYRRLLQRDWHDHEGISPPVSAIGS